MKKQDEDDNHFLKKLREIQEEPSFRVPEGYFEHFPERVMNRIRAEESAPQVRGFFKHSQKIAAVLAGFILLSLAAYLYLNSPVKDKQLSFNSEDLQAEEFEEDLLTDVLVMQGQHADSSAGENFETYLVEHIEEDLLIQEL